MIEARDLTKRFGSLRAVDALTFEAPRGQIVGLLGPNGAGKTTAIRMLCGYIPPTAGQAIIDGCDVLTQSAQVRRRIGYLPEHTPLYQEMTVAEFLHFRGRLHGMPRRRRRERIEALTERCGLSLILKRVIGTLSRGNRQRVGLAQALMHDPPVLFLDEPTAGLDPNQIQEVRKLLADLRGRHTIVLSSHILPEIEKTADRVIVIARGRVVVDDAVANLRSQGPGDHQEYVIELHAPLDSARQHLAGAKGVASVAAETVPAGGSSEDGGAGWVRLTVRCETSSNPMHAAEVLGRCIAEKGWAVRAFNAVTPSLEALFVQVTAAQDRAGGEGETLTDRESRKGGE